MTRSLPDDWSLMRYVSDPDQDRVSGLIAYTLSLPRDWGYDQRIALLGPGGGEVPVPGKASRITAGGNREEMPRFSPDGRTLAFLSDASGEPQLWACSFDDGTVRQLSRLVGGVDSFAWSPDGKGLAVVSPCAPAKGGGATGTEAPAQAAVIEEIGYKRDGVKGFKTRAPRHLFVVPAEGGDARRLTDGDRDHLMPAWSPDGGSLAFVSDRCRKRDEGVAMDLFVIAAEGGPVTRLTEGLWIACYPVPFQPLFSPGGDEIIIGALEMHKHEGFPPTRLFAIPSKGGEPRSLWPQGAPCHEATCFVYNVENYGRVAQTAQISEDGEGLYFISGREGACDVFRANLSGGPGIARVTDGKACYRSLCRPLGARILAAKGSPSSTPQLVSLDLATGRDEALTDSNPWLRDRALSLPQELWVDTLDGKGRVHGFVLPPQQAQEGAKYPAVLCVHGGPAPFYGLALCYEHQLLAAAGMGVILCNPRGSGGYGEEHAEQSQAFDGTAMTDLLQFLDAAAGAFPWVDAGRVGVTGGSYGGYMTNWLITHTRRFRAAVTQRCIASELISYASSDMPGSSGDYGDFKDFMKAAIRKSPVAYADRIVIPLLILHGMEDKRCPVEHAHQLFTAVKDAHPDLPVRMALFPDGDHSMTMEGPLRHRLAHCREMTDWFLKYL